MRTMFSRFVFDEEKCYAGLESLKAYRRAWNETQKTWAEHPEHSWASHGADALGCFATAWKEDTPAVQVPTSFYHPAKGLWGRR
jgi:hypothetical protein